jgi:DNA-binding transcriptional ArsR family regulator
MINQTDLILHPDRLQIIEALVGRALTTQEIAEHLSGVPKSSIYRHLRTLLEGGLVEVAETRPVKGTLEKVYRLAGIPHLTQADLAGYSRADLRRYFAMFLATQLQGFSNYLEASAQPDFQADYVGFSEAVFDLPPEGVERMLRAIQQVLVEYHQDPPAESGHRHKLAIITYPLIQGENNHE